jgi:hypothetical protein
MSGETPTSGRGPRQMVEPRRIIIASFLSSEGSDAGTAKFRVKAGDPRLRVRISIHAVPKFRRATPQSVFTGRNLKLWAAGMVEDSVKGGIVPVSNMTPGATAAAPEDLPNDAGLAGWSREFSSIADAIDGLITIPDQDPDLVPGTLVVQAKFMPQVFHVVPWDEWQEVRSECDLLPVEVYEG